MKSSLSIKFGLVSALMLTSACSMKDRTEVHSVSVQLPQVWANSSNLNILNHSSSNLSINYSNPTNLASFQCYGLNVTGPGIQSDSRMQCTDPASGMGMIAGFVPVSSGQIEMMVPAGADRKVELIGIQSDIGCPILDALLANGGVEALSDLGSPYVLGSTTTDIFDDTGVTIVASFDPTKKAFEGCGGGENNNSDQLRINVINDSPAIQENNCAPFGVYANGQGPYPSVQPSITYTGAGTVTLYTDSGCTNMVSGYTSFGSGSYLEYYVKTVGASGSFTAQVLTTATGWDTPIETFSIVSDRLLAAPTPMPNVDTCSSVVLWSQNSVAAPVNLGTINFEVHNNNNSNSPSSMQVYTGAGCTGLITPISTSESSSYYTLGAVALTSTTIYVQNAVGEQVSIGFSRANDSAQPAQASITFVPFQVSSMPPNMLEGPSMTTIPSFNIPFIFGEGLVTAVKFGATPCGAVSVTTGNVSCAIPSVMGNGTFPINLTIGGMDYYSGYSFTFGVQPSFASGSSSYMSNCTGPNKCSYVTAYHIAASQSPVNVMPQMTGAPLMNCTASPSLPLGLNLTPNCTISGTSGSANGVPIEYTITGNASGYYYLPVTTSIWLNVQ